MPRSGDWIVPTLAGEPFMEKPPLYYWVAAGFSWLLSGWQDQLDLEARVQQEMAATDDFAEGVMAFVQKRPSAFSGR